jgi:hypothetical protein
MRAVLFLLLVQFTTPAFVSLVAQGDSDTQHEKITKLNQEHKSPLPPLLLKEKEENKREGVQSNFIPQPIFDFSEHSSALIESHQSKYVPARYAQWHDHQPRLFTLFCTYNI